MKHKIEKAILRVSPSLQDTKLLHELVKSVNRIFEDEAETIKRVSAYRALRDRSVYDSGLDMGL